MTTPDRRVRSERVARALGLLVGRSEARLAALRIEVLRLHREIDELYRLAGDPAVAAPALAVHARNRQMMLRRRVEHLAARIGVETNVLQALRRKETAVERIERRIERDLTGERARKALEHYVSDLAASASRKLGH
ncbi:MAG: hypothetical protein KGM42_02215 [Hyphomicrobiales bacterium]|nr:hypothetical protein [Hyphomicrobiales bacterium]